MKYKKKEFAEKHGLTCGKHCVWGVYEGYHVHIKYTPVGNPRCLITVVTAAGGKEKSLEKYLGAQKNKLNISNFGVVKLGLMVCPKFTGEVFARAEHILDEICAHLKKAGFAGADVCPYCGAAIKEGGVLATESDIPFRVHEGCYEAALAGAREKDRLNAEKPDRKALGMLGGFWARCSGRSFSFSHTRGGGSVRSGRRQAYCWGTFYTGRAAAKIRCSVRYIALRRRSYFLLRGTFSGCSWTRAPRAAVGAPCSMHRFREGRLRRCSSQISPVTCCLRRRAASTRCILT